MGLLVGDLVAVRLLTLLPMPCDGVGPSYTCTKLLSGMAGRGLAGPLYANRVRAPLPTLDYRVALPGPLAKLPYRYVSGMASRLTVSRYLAEVREGDIAYLWPSAPLEVYEAVRARGLPIIGEGINTRMESARDILDAVYAAEGLPPSHGITEARIREENEKLAMTTAIFAPSLGVETSLKGSPLQSGGVLRASYGVALDERRPPRRQVPEDGPTVLFVGSGGIRKGLHQLLRGWAASGVRGRLMLAGTIEPSLRSLCADLLDRPDVEALGFVRDVDALYERADVFVLPSFEEGDPLVTYEAAAHGLPIIASPMGAGRIGEETDCALVVDPTAPDTIAEALRLLCKSPGEMEARGERSLAAAANYSWDDVGARRAEMLLAHLGL